MGIFATRDIYPNEELTYDYDFDYLEGSESKCACFCGSANCSGSIGVKKKVEPPKSGKRVVLKTGLAIYQAEFAAGHKKPAKHVKQAKLTRAAKTERVNAEARAKELKADAKAAWDALGDAEKATYESKAEEINKLKQLKKPHAAKNRKRNPKQCSVASVNGWKTRRANGKAKETAAEATSTVVDDDDEVVLQPRR